MQMIQAAKRMRENILERALSPPGFRAIRDARSGNVVQVRRMSGSAAQDFHHDANPANFEFQVLSNDDIARFVRACDQHGEAQWNHMEQRMEQNASFSAEQMQYLRQEFRAEVMQVVGYGRQEYESVQNEARQHQRFWVSKYGHLEEMTSETQKNLLQELGQQ